MVRARPSVPGVLGGVLLLIASAVLTFGPPQPAAAQVTDLQRQLAQTAAERAAAARELAEVRRRTDSARDRFNVAQREHQTAQAELARVDD